MKVLMRIGGGIVADFEMDASTMGNMTPFSSW